MSDTSDPLVVESDIATAISELPYAMRVRAIALTIASRETLGNSNAGHTVRTADTYEDYILNGSKKENDSE